MGAKRPDSVRKPRPPRRPDEIIHGVDVVEVDVDEIDCRVLSQVQSLDPHAYDGKPQRRTAKR